MSIRKEHLMIGKINNYYNFRKIINALVFKNKKILLSFKKGI